MRVDILAVGVDNYFDSRGWIEPKLKLEFAASDAAKVVDVARSAFDVRRSWLLSDGAESRTRPNRNDIIRALRMAASLEPGDATLLVYFAGHGIGIGGALHLCPADYDHEIREYSSLGLDLLCEILSERQGNKCLILDCCRASLDGDEGSAARMLSRKRLPTSEELAILTGCSAGQHAFESAKIGARGGGVFTHFLFSALRDFALAHGHEFFSLAEVFRDSRDNTAEYVFEKTGVASQKPVAFGADLSEFLLASNRPRQI